MSNNNEVCKQSAFIVYLYDIEGYIIKALEARSIEEAKKAGKRLLRLYPFSSYDVKEARKAGM